MEEENKELQKYNREDIEKLKEAIIEVAETIIEAVKPTIETVIDVTKKFYNEIVKVFTVDPEIKKCYGIYKRTKKRKDKKKAINQDK